MSQVQVSRVRKTGCSLMPKSSASLPQRCASFAARVQQQQQQTCQKLGVQGWADLVWTRLAGSVR